MSKSAPWTEEDERERVRMMAVLEERTAALRELLETFTQRQPYIDNVAHRIIMWAENGFEGRP